jgi:CRP-like cAMP-binding protein
LAERVHLDPGEIAAHLAATRLFALLDPQELARLAGLFRAVRYGPGQLIARQGGRDAALWIVIDGQVSFDRREPDDRIRHLGFRGYGAVIGERGVFASEGRTNSVLTIEPTALLYVEGDKLWRALHADPATFDRLVLPDSVREHLAMQEVEQSVEGEHRVAVYRRHWLVLLRGMVGPAVVLTATLGLATLVAPLAPSPSVVLVLALIAVGAPLLGAVWAFFDYRYDTLIVTNRRVIHIERTPFIDTRRTEAPLARVQDVHVVRPGLTARLMGFGHITIQTAGTRGAIRFTTVPNPRSVRETVFEQVELAQEQARRERLAWINRRLRVALGREPPRPGDRPEADRGDSDELEERATGSAVPRLIVLLVGLLGRMLPKMRVQQGTTVTWRKHWWILLRSVWYIALPWVFVTAALAVAIVRPGALPWQGLFLIWAILNLALWWQFEDWRNELYQLTDEHIIDVERLPLGFFEDRRQARLTQIQDIRYTVPNPLATLLNYGNVVIETAAESGNFTFDFVYNPASVQEEIFARMEQRRARAQQAEEERRADEMTRWLTQYHRIAGEAGNEGEDAPSDAPPGAPAT